MPTIYLVLYLTLDNAHGFAIHIHLAGVRRSWEEAKETAKHFTHTYIMELDLEDLL